MTENEAKSVGTVGPNSSDLFRPFRAALERWNDWQVCRSKAQHRYAVPLERCTGTGGGFLTHPNQPFRSGPILRGERWNAAPGCSLSADNFVCSVRSGQPSVYSVHQASRGMIRRDKLEDGHRLGDRATATSITTARAGAAHGKTRAADEVPPGKRAISHAICCGSAR